MVTVPKKKDVAKNTILVLLVLTIILSLISTLVVFNAFSSIKQAFQISSKNSQSVSHGQISIGIAGNNSGNQGPQMTEKGNVRLEIVP